MLYEMLGPAVNRQPGFRRGTRRAKQRREEQPCWLAGWLARAGWLGLARAGWLPRAGWVAGWLAAGQLPPGWLADSLDLAGSGWLAQADWLAYDWLSCWLAG